MNPTRSQCGNNQGNFGSFSRQLLLGHKQRGFTTAAFIIASYFYNRLYKSERASKAKCFFFSISKDKQKAQLLKHGLRSSRERSDVGGIAASCHKLHRTFAGVTNAAINPNNTRLNWGALGPSRGDEDPGESEEGGKLL